MVKVILVLAALVGSVVGEPPLGLGLNLGIGNYALNLGNLPLASGGYAQSAYAPQGYAQPVLLAGHQPYIVKSPAYAPTGLNFALGFDKNFGFGGHHAGGYRAPAILKAAPVVLKKPIVSYHNYDHGAFHPIVKKPAVYKGYHGSHFSITPSISYGYSYKLVPTSNYGPVVSGGYGAPAVYKVPVHHGHHDHHGNGKSLGLDLNFNLGH